MKNFTLPAVVLAAVIFTPIAQAQEEPTLQNPQWYAGAGVGQNTYQKYCDLVELTNCDNSDTAYKIFGGAVIHRYFGVEVGSVDLGDATADVSVGSVNVPVTSNVTTLYIVAVGQYPVNDSFTIYAKLGVHQWEGDVTAQGVTATTDDTDPVFGIGAEYVFNNNIGVRAEWEKFDFNRTDGNFLSAGVTYRF